MATIDYKEKYEQALEVAQRFYNNSVAITKKGLEDIFPELAISEDEKIRSALLRGFNSMFANQAVPTFAGEPIRDILAWLEKQGEKAKYHDICDTCVRQPTCQSDCFLQQDEQKKEWSKEDEYYRNIILYILNNECVGKTDKENAINWLKSLKDRVQLQSKQEWSEEDDSKLKEVLYYIEYVNKTNVTFQQRDLVHLINWLKSLKGRYTWKPSSEQMRVLDLAIRCGINRGTTEETTLVSLFNDLKKLREE